MDNIQVTIKKIVFSSPETGFSVMRSRIKGGGEATLVGSMAGVSEGAVVDCSGEWTVDKKFGRQFSVKAFTENMPVSASGIELFLGSGMFKGIGPKCASLIVRTFGGKTLEIIDKSPERLTEVPGIGRSKMETIKESWQQHRHLKNVMVFLREIGVSVSLAKKIHDKYGGRAVSVIKENPYILADDLYGVGFKKADAIALSMGFSHNDPHRIRSGILFVMNSHCTEGHVFSDYKTLLAQCAEILGVDVGEVGLCISDMVKDEQVIKEGEAVYLPMMHRCELGVASKLRRLMEHNDRRLDLGVSDVDADDTGIEYDEVQKKAIHTAASSKVMILTGGPGTGKTTTLKGIISSLKQSGMKLILAAPTGRAAKRMSEATGMKAKTIHRLLEFNPKGGFARNDANPLKGDALIVDECSMIDIILMNSLLKAMPLSMRLILVGDVDQLPSVGPGNVLRDMIESGTLPVVRLTRIFRQAQSSMIVMNAHSVNRGLMPKIDNSSSKDFFFMECENVADMPGKICSLVNTRLPGYYNVKRSDIQVLSPMRRGAAGTDFLNEALQHTLNPSGECIRRGATVYRVGDRVMQIRNDYEKDVFNGDVGYIRVVDAEEGVVAVDFDGRLVQYDTAGLDGLVLAYASTIHKSQGSEYPIVVMPVHTSHFIMLQRNLIYTGITRSKKVCVIVGTKKALGMAVRNNDVLRRNTRLVERIRGEV